MVRLTQTLADKLTTREIVVAQTEDGEDITVKIRSINPQYLLRMFKDQKDISSLSKDITDEEILKIMQSDSNMTMISDVVKEVMVEPRVVDDNPKEDEVTLNQIAPYHLEIYTQAMAISGFGDEAKTFRGVANSDEGGDSGEGVRETPNRITGPGEREQPLEA